MNRQHIKQAFVTSLPIALGYVPLGVICGMLLEQAGLKIWHIAAMSFFVFAGSSQFVAAGMFATMATAPSIILATFIINLRQMLYSSSLSSYLQLRQPHKIILFSQFITDETFAVNTKQYLTGQWTDEEATLMSMVANGYWVVGNVIGALFGKYLGIPVALASFALTAMFIILLVLQFKQASDLKLWLIGTGVAVVVYSVHQSGFSIIISTAITVTIALLIDGRKPAHLEADDE